jgi:hypothetical protein
MSIGEITKRQAELKELPDSEGTLSYFGSPEDFDIREGGDYTFPCPQCPGGMATINRIGGCSIGELVELAAEHTELHIPLDEVKTERMSMGLPPISPRAVRYAELIIAFTY